MRKRSTFLGAVAAVASTAVLATAAAPAASSSAQAAIPVLCPVIVGNPSNDPVRIVLSANYNFGSAGGLDSNFEPDGCGTLTWDLANGTINPRLTGTLYAKNAIGTKVRMSCSHRDVDGTLLWTTNIPPKLVGSDDVDGVPDQPVGVQQPADLPGRCRAPAGDQRRLGGPGHRVVYIGSSTKAPDAARRSARAGLRQRQLHQRRTGG